MPITTTAGDGTRNRARPRRGASPDGPAGSGTWGGVGGGGAAEGPAVRGPTTQTRRSRDRHERRPRDLERESDDVREIFPCLIRAGFPVRFREKIGYPLCWVLVGSFNRLRPCFPKRILDFRVCLGVVGFLVKNSEWVFRKTFPIPLEFETCEVPRENFRCIFWKNFWMFVVFEHPHKNFWKKTVLDTRQNLWVENFY